MLYRVPAELDFLLPQYPLDDASPWKGNLLWRGADNDPDQPENHLAFVHAVETEGDAKSQTWPRELSLRTSRSGFSISNVHAWVKKVAPPLCMLMPGPNEDPKLNRGNQNNFRSFAKLLRDREIVAISRWHDPDRVPGSGIIIFPVEVTDGLLAAAVFHSMPIPEFTPCDQCQAYPDVYRDYAPQSPSSHSSSHSTQSWPSPPTISHSTSSSSILVYNGNSVWPGESYSTPSYAIPRSHYFHLSIPPIDTEAARQYQYSTLPASSDLLDFDWFDTRAYSTDIPEELEYNLLSVADPDWNFLSSSYTLASP